jgi:signal peptidase II
VTPKLRTLLVTLAVVVPLDQLTKWWVSANVSQFDPLVVIPGFFQITHARNTGMALGLFREMPVIFFIVATLIALVAVVSVYRQFPTPDRHAGVSLGLIVGGAIGNLIDRVARGSVVDFLQFDLQVFIFPDFNVADSAIVIGVLLLLLEIGATDSERPSGVPEEVPAEAAARAEERET